MHGTNKMIWKDVPMPVLKEKDVLIRRLRSLTLEKIGLKLGVTEARIRQIEKKALKKIATKSYQQKLFSNTKSLH